MATSSEIMALRERLAKAEALAARGATPGEKAAARAAVERIRRRMEMPGGGGAHAGAAPPPPPRPPPPCEFRYRIRDPWGQRVFQALCEAQGYEPYRRKRERRGTFRVQVPGSVEGGRLFDRYIEIEVHLKRDLEAVTDRVIREMMGKR